MRAIVYEGPRSVSVREVAEPTLTDPSDVVVRVKLAGICGTDLHATSGDFPGMTPGSIVGHEFVGDVVATGTAVTRLKVGDHVMASDFTACGHCRWCTRGDHWECADRAFFGTGTSFGPALSGAQAELVRVPHAEITLSVVPPGCSDEAAILIGDNLAAGWAAIERSSMTPGDVVVIVGGGTVGQLTSLSAQAAGAGAIIVVEPKENRRDFARANGALAVPPEEARRLVAALTDDDGADIVVEAVGAAAALRSAFDYVRKRGCIVSVGAYTDNEWPLPLAKSFASELSLTFAIGDSIRLRSRLLKLVRLGILDPTVVVDARIGFSAAASAYRDLRAQKIMKAVIDPSLS